MKDCDIGMDTISEVLLSVASCDQLVSETFDLFNNTYRIEKYMTQNFNYIKPVRLALGTGDFHYVPVIETLRKITEDRSFQKHRKVYSDPSSNKQEDIDFCLSDFEDGSRLRRSDYFSSNPDALRYPFS